MERRIIERRADRCSGHSHSLRAEYIVFAVSLMRRAGQVLVIITTNFASLLLRFVRMATGCRSRQFFKVSCIDQI